MQQMDTMNKGEKETLLEKITLLGKDVSAWFLSIRITSVLVVLACFGYGYALTQGLTSSSMDLIIVAVLVANQVFIARTRIKQRKLAEMKTSYEARFGAIPSTK